MDKTAASKRQEAEPAAPSAGAGADIIYLPDERQQQKQKAKSGSNRRKRQHVEQFRTDDAEHEALHERLRTSGLSLGEYVLQIGAFEGGKTSRRRRRREIKTPDDFEVLASQIVVALNRGGNNLNQIARGMNEFLLIAHERSNAQLESFVLEVLDAIRGMPAQFEEPVAAIKAAFRS